VKRAVVALLLALCAILFVERAHAESGIRVVVRELGDDGTPSVRNAVLGMLSKHKQLQLVSVTEFEKVADRLGVKLSGSAGVRAVAKPLEIGAVIEGEVDAGEEGATVTLRVRNSDGEVVETHELAAKTLPLLLKEVRAKGWKLLGSALLDGAPPKKKSDAKPRIVLSDILPPRAAELRASLESALAKNQKFELVPEQESLAARAPEAEKPDDQVLVALSLGASALLRGEAKLGGQSELVLTVLNGKNGRELGRIQLKGFGLAGLRRAIASDFEKKLEPLLADASLPALHPEDIENDPVSAEPVVEEKADPRPSALEGVLAIRAGTRNYRYSDDLFGVLRAYRMGVTPAAFGSLRWYPIAHFQGGPLAHVGITASYEQAFLIQSEANGKKYSSTSKEWTLGLRGRVPVAPLELGLEVAAGEHVFAIDDDPNLPLIPDVDYRFVRLGTDARARFGAFSLGGSFGYRRISDSGAIQTRQWFPRLEVAGLDTGLFVGHSPLAHFDVLVGVQYRRYWFSMKPEPGDRNVAGGALDSYISGWVGVGAQLPGD